MEKLPMGQDVNWRLCSDCARPHYFQTFCTTCGMSACLSCEDHETQDEEVLVCVGCGGKFYESKNDMIVREISKVVSDYNDGMINVVEGMSKIISLIQ